MINLIKTTKFNNNQTKILKILFKNLMNKLMNLFRTWILMIIYQTNNLHLMTLMIINNKEIVAKINKICLMSLMKWMFSNNHKIIKQQLSTILMTTTIHNNKQIKVLILMILIIKILIHKITSKKIFLMILITKLHNKINKQHLTNLITIRIKVKNKTTHLMSLTNKTK